MRRAARKKGVTRRPHAHATASAGVARCAILTISDTRRGADDKSGARIERLLERAGHPVVTRAWCTDTLTSIRRVAKLALNRDDVDALIATGGTGIAPRDRTPQAFAALIDTPIPGFGELFRSLSYDDIGSAAWLSRAAAGVARGRLVVLLPGSTAAVDLAVRRLLIPELGHGMKLLERDRREK